MRVREINATQHNAPLVLVYALYGRPSSRTIAAAGSGLIALCHNTTKKSALFACAGKTAAQRERAPLLPTLARAGHLVPLGVGICLLLRRLRHSVQELVARFRTLDAEALASIRSWSWSAGCTATFPLPSGRSCYIDVDLVCPGGGGRRRRRRRGGAEQQRDGEEGEGIIEWG
jgi:hypothetical protein